MKAPERFVTRRLLLRRPHADDAEAIFERYAADPDVTRLLGWPRHGSVDDTRAFLRFSDAAWDAWPAGPYLIEAREGGTLVGSTGFAFETRHRASTGYVIAKDDWGKGYATEALRAVVEIAQALRLVRLYALCHVDHRASWRVLEKCGFVREAVLRQHSEFPNLGTTAPCDVLLYATIFEWRPGDDGGKAA